MSTATSTVDILIIGGGINGSAIACEAASRGLKTLLVEARDISGGASSSTTTLFSGSLRQLEKLEWDTVKKCLNEQAITYRRAPHLIAPREFIIPPNPAIRSSRRVKAGLYLYSLLQDADIQQVEQSSDAALYLKSEYQGTQHYHDCTVNDSRLTLSTALLAQELGATILPRHTVTGAKRNGKHWQVTVQPNHHPNSLEFNANIVVNASGWHVNDTLKDTLECPSRCNARLLRGDHIIVPKPYQGNQAYALQAPGRHLVYVAPLDEDFVVIGPTQTLKDDKENNSTEKLLGIYNQYFNTELKAEKIVHSYSGVHAVYDDATCDDMDKSRDYFLDLDCPNGRSPLLNVFGGFLTTHRLLAEQALGILQPYTRAPANKELKTTPLPGGDFADGDINAFCNELQTAYPKLNPALLNRLGHTYGSLSYQILGDAKCSKDLGKHFGQGLFGAEVRYLCHHEWAQTADDILWRRTKLGLVMDAEEKQELSDWLTYSFE